MSERSATVWAEAARRLRRVPGVVVLGVLLGVAGPPSATTAQATSAVVEGAARVNIRRGPGTNFPSLTTVRAGDRVEVEGLEGEWAHIRTASGTTGYIRSVFLSLSGAAPAAAPAPQDTPPREAAAGAASPPSSAAVATAGAQPSETAPSGETDAERVRRLQAELTRVTAEREGLQRQLEQRATEPAPLGSAAPSGGTATDPGEPFSAGTLGAVVIALLVGWLTGMAAGRRQERNRRSRIRF